LTDKNGIVHVAAFFDPNLLNPWGVGESLTSPFWVSDNGNGTSSLYNTAGQPQSLVVAIPAPGDPLGASGAPTGLAFNAALLQGAFKISGFMADGVTPTTAPSVFLFATEDGTILGWNPRSQSPGHSTRFGGQARDHRRQQLERSRLQGARRCQGQRRQCLPVRNQFQRGHR
jgi:hypothetical protein